MSSNAETVARPKADFLTKLDDHFPSWGLVEVFGPPGAGKTYLCEQLVEIPGILTTANHRALQYYADCRQSRLTRAMLPYLGRKFAKNYYGHQCRVLERQTLDMCGKSEREFLAKALDLVAAAPMPVRTREKITRSILRSTGLTILSREEGMRLALDEGFVRRLIDIFWRMKEASAPSKHFDLMKACAEQFPFERNAVAVVASPAVCVMRQNLRGQIIASPEKPQMLFHDATDGVSAMCKRAGWKILAVDNS